MWAFILTIARWFWSLAIIGQKNHALNHEEVAFEIVVSFALTWINSPFINSAISIFPADKTKVQLNRFLLALVYIIIQFNLTMDPKTSQSWKPIKENVPSHLLQANPTTYYMQKCPAYSPASSRLRKPQKPSWPHLILDKPEEGIYMYRNWTSDAIS